VNGPGAPGVSKRGAAEVNLEERQVGSSSLPDVEEPEQLRARFVSWGVTLDCSSVPPNHPNYGTELPSPVWPQPEPVAARLCGCL